MGSSSSSSTGILDSNVVVVDGKAFGQNRSHRHCNHDGTSQGQGKGQVLMAQTTITTTTTFAISWRLAPLSLRTKDNGGAEARGQSRQCGQEQRSGPIRIIIVVVVVVIVLLAAAAAAGRVVVVVVVERHAQCVHRVISWTSHSHPKKYYSPRQI
jgi:hypothetical protein